MVMAALSVKRMGRLEKVPFERVVPGKTRVQPLRGVTTLREPRGEEALPEGPLESVEVVSRTLGFIQRKLLGRFQTP